MATHGDHHGEPQRHRGSDGRPDATRWTGIDFRHLGALAAVAREGSFRRAAEKLGYVQSAVSSQISQLESAVGSQLIERSSGSPGATLTPAGRVLLEHVDEILGRFEAARIDMRALADGEGTTVRVSVLEGVAQRRLPAILSAFLSRFPLARVEIDEDDGDRTFERLAGGGLDVAISELPLPPGPFDHIELEQDRYILLVAADSELAQASGPPVLEQLSRLPLILPAATRKDDPVATWLRNSPVDQPPWLRPQGAAAAQALVGSGMGLALLPRLATDLDDPLTAAIEIPPLLPDRRIVLVKHREREHSDVVNGFVELAEAGFAAQRPHRS